MTRGAWFAVALATIAVLVTVLASLLLRVPPAQSEGAAVDGGVSRPAAANKSPRDRAMPPATLPGRSEVVPSRPTGMVDRDAQPVTIHGSAVDADRRPLPGITVAVTGHPRYRDHAAFVIAHGPVSFVPPAPQVTGSDGRFALTFLPPPPFEVTLSLSTPALVPVQVHWSTLPAGAAADLGEVVLAPGCRVSGRVVDQEARARGGLRLVVQATTAAASVKLPASGAGGELGTPYTEPLVTGVDGAFVLHRRVAAGILTFTAEEGALLTPAEATIAAGVADHHVLLTVADVAAGRCIRGRVVDEAGRGIAAAMVRTLRQGVVARTNDEGAYTLVRDESQDGEPTLVVADKGGYERGTAADPVPFGARGVTIVLRAGVPCELLVREGATGQPVERYGVRIRPVASEGFEGSAVSLQHAGVHPGGRLRIAGLMRGPHEVTVEADPARFPPSPLMRFLVADGMDPVTVELFGLVDFAVVIRDDRGAPVVGSVAELIEAPATVAPLEDRPVVPRADLGRIYGNLLYCVAKADSGEDGVARMKAPRGASFVLRVNGAAHVPIELRDVDTARGRIEVLAPRGACILGRITPPEVLQAQVPHEGCGLLRTLQLRSLDGVRRFPATGMVEVDAAGTFRVDAVPAGDWMLHAVLVSVAPGWERSAMLPLARIDGLVSGETRPVVVDLARLRPATLRARITWNGRPAAGRLVSAAVRIPGAPGGTVTVPGGAARVGEDGVAVLALVPGQVTLALTIEDGAAPGTARELRAAETCELAGGDVVERTFSMRSADLRLRVVDASGAGVPGARLLLRAGEDVAVSGATDATGRVAIAALASGEHVLGLVPRPVAERFARGEQIDLRSVEDVRIRSLVVEAGMEEVVVRVPRGAGY